MFGIADYGAFVAAIVLFLAIPGPGNLALITSTSKGGIRGGLAATLGVIAGDHWNDATTLNSSTLPIQPTDHALEPVANLRTNRAARTTE